jgi:hypothetical protein
MRVIKKYLNEMSIATHSELETFIRAYLNTFHTLSSKLSESQKTLLLPRYLNTKCEIIGTISKANGISVRFKGGQEKESFDFQDTSKSIEDEVLPTLSQKGEVFFILNGERQVLENVNLMTREFYDGHKELIEKLTRSTNFVMSGAEKFVDVISGDLKLIDCTLAFCEGGRNALDRIDCLWLLGSNRSSDFSKSKAEMLAKLEYEKLASVLVNRIPIQNLIGTLAEYKKLIDNKSTTESEMQSFFENNWALLEINARRILPKFDMGGENIPDFIIETSDFRYVIVEIEGPNEEIYTAETPPRPSRKLREADSQTKTYLSYALNNILFLRQKLPFLSGEKIRGLIVIGRSDTLSPEQKKRLDQDRGFSKDIDIVTYDELFESLRIFLENLGFRYSQV